MEAAIARFIALAIVAKPIDLKAVQEKARMYDGFGMSIVRGRAVKSIGLARPGWALAMQQ